MTIEQATEQVIIEKLKKAIVDNDMVATGALLNSVKLESTERLGIKTIEIRALDYIVGLNDGLPPGTPTNFIDIAKWIEAKGLDLNPFAVAQNINQLGTTWYRQGGSHIVTDSVNAETFRQVIELAKEEQKLKIKDQWQLLFKNNR